MENTAGNRVQDVLPYEVSVYVVEEKWFEYGFCRSSTWRFDICHKHYSYSLFSVIFRSLKLVWILQSIINIHWKILTYLSQDNRIHLNPNNNFEATSYINASSIKVWIGTLCLGFYMFTPDEINDILENREISVFNRLKSIRWSISLIFKFAKKLTQFNSIAQKAYLVSR